MRRNGKRIPVRIDYHTQESDAFITLAEDVNGEVIHSMTQPQLSHCPEHQIDPSRMNTVAVTPEEQDAVTYVVRPKLEPSIKIERYFHIFHVNPLMSEGIGLQFAADIEINLRQDP
ncbi:hypothetical protein [Solihabitans fulvus]|nr:hypothetical protein [Solihabitans fulvus]